jgi:putative sterol carrier protein
MDNSALVQGVSWQRSSSCTLANCVEVAVVNGGASVALRDSKNPDSVLLYSALEWSDFINGVTNGDFDKLSLQ